MQFFGVDVVRCKEPASKLSGKRTCSVRSLGGRAGLGSTRRHQGLEHALDECDEKDRKEAEATGDMVQVVRVPQTEGF